jgi:hypothetical protein
MVTLIFWRPTLRMSMFVAVLSLRVIISQSKSLTVRRVPAGASAISPQPQSRSRDSSPTTVPRSSLPSCIWRNTSTMTGILIVDAAGRLAVALTPDVMPVARSSSAIPTRPGACSDAAVSWTCRPASGEAACSAASAMDGANAITSASATRKTSRRRCCISLSLNIPFRATLTFRRSVRVTGLAYATFCCEF